ncbi:hypothetical protein CRENBAI_023164 [Crenichthys baileyi]|uniref:Uncharacterized protein n=1 Tax=Crenichthys baileyi TaxID=28760 RepID=A0AAV9REM5_9TELE
MSAPEDDHVVYRALRDPPNEPTVEAPAKPPLPVEDEAEEQLDETHYDLLEKTSTTTERPLEFFLR